MEERGDREGKRRDHGIGEERGWQEGGDGMGREERLDREEGEMDLEEGAGGKERDQKVREERGGPGDRRGER